VDEPTKVWVATYPDWEDGEVIDVFLAPASASEHFKVLFVERDGRWWSEATDEHPAMMLQGFTPK